MKPSLPSKDVGASAGPGGSSDLVVVRRHLRFGWWSLLFFLTVGLILEGLHGFKVAAYLKTSMETRRVMWTLAHAHGTMLALVHLGFAFTIRTFPEQNVKAREWASAFLRAATLLIPAGFALGGMFIYAGDPGLGILLVPLGALLLFAAVFMTAHHVTRSAVQPDSAGSKGSRRP